MMRSVLAWSLVVSGWMSRYASPATMQAVINNRQAGKATPHLPQELPHVWGYIAMRDSQHIGKVALVCDVELPELVPCHEPVPIPVERCRTALVADCAGIADGAWHWMTNKRIALEWDALSATAWDAAGLGRRVFVYFENEAPATTGPICE